MKRKIVAAFFVVSTLFAGGTVFAGGTKESASAPAKSITELEFVLMKPEAIDTFNEIAKRFTAANPGIIVKITTIPDRDSRMVLYTRLAAGLDVPDIFSAYPNESQFADLVSNGYVYDLTGQDFLANANSSVLKGVAQKGKDYSLPLSMNTIGVFYNTDIFSRFGIAIPKTYAEFIASAKKIKAAGTIPILISGKDPWTVGIIANLSTGSEMGKDSADAFFADLNRGTASSAGNPTMNIVADRIIELSGLANDDAVAVDYSMAIDRFASGKAAMYINGIWAIPSVMKANPDLKFDMFPLPAIKEKDTKTIYGIDTAISVAAKTKHPAEALKFLRFVASTEIAQYFSDVDNSPSVIKGVSVKSDKIKKLVALLDKGQAFEWLHFKWAAGMESGWNNATGTLIFTKDKAKYFQDLDKMFLNSIK